MFDALATGTGNVIGETVGTLVIGRRFNGPPASANGGYSCGRIAAFVDGPARVTLRKPPPLNTELTVRRTGPGAIEIVANDVVYAEAVSVNPGVVVLPARPTLADAFDARSRHPWIGVQHMLSDCFVCGPERSDGLRVTPGPLAGVEDVTAAPFVPDATVAGADGMVPSEIVWAALDCSSYPPEALAAGPLCLLGRLTVVQRKPIRLGDQLVAVGWTLAVSGRKHHTAAALLDRNGATVAQSEAVWVAIG